MLPVAAARATNKQARNRLTVSGAARVRAGMGFSRHAIFKASGHLTACRSASCVSLNIFPLPVSKAYGVICVIGGVKVAFVHYGGLASCGGLRGVLNVSLEVEASFRLSGR